MSCKDKQKFKTAEASSKASLRTKGAIDKFLNILDVNVFNRLNKKWTVDAVERFGIEGKLFYNENDKAVANKEAFKKIDNAKGIFYQNTQSVSDQGIIASEQTIRDLSARIADRIGMTVKFESDRTKDYKGKIENNVAYVNLAYATLDTPIHEILGHPIIRAIKNKKSHKELEVFLESDFNNYGTKENPEYFIDLKSLKDTESQNKVKHLFDKEVEDGETFYNKKFKTQEEGKEFVKKIKDVLLKDSTNLYQNLLKELETGKGKEVLDRIKKDYQFKEIKETYKIIQDEYTKYYKVVDKNENYSTDDIFNSFDLEKAKEHLNKKNTPFKYTLEEQQEEAIVELLGLMTAEKLDNVKDGKLISLLKRLLKEMKQFIRSLINQKEVDIDKLPDNMTLGDLSDLLAYSNSKLILPGNEVEYTTPDNMKFKTYAEASNHISQLAKSVEDVDLSNVKINNKRGFEVVNVKTFKRKEFKTLKEAMLYKNTNPDLEILEYEDNYNIANFIEKNKEYEQSKEIIEEWKKVNNIKYNPEEIYSRGQEFSSVVGAYSSFDVNLMMQNLLSHIEDNKKAGGKFAISAFTKPVDKTIGHLEGGGGKIKFKIYPQSKDILWASNIDVYSGSVWDASEKVNKDKKSELLGVSYTKYPSLSNVNSVQPNLASIVDDLAHHHNELGIALTGNNFRLEYDEDIPYTTKKIIDGINKILDQKYGKLVKPEIKNSKKEKVFSIIKTDPNTDEVLSSKIFNTEQEAWDYYYNQLAIHRDFVKNRDDIPFPVSVKIYDRQVGIQPTQTNETLTESIESIKKEYLNISYNNYYIHEDGSIYEPMPDDLYYEENQYEEVFDENGEYLGVIEKSFKSNKKEIRKFREGYEKNQALINTKIAALKEVAKKQPRSLIRSEVVLVNKIAQKNRELGFDGDELPFQKIPSVDFNNLKGSKKNELDWNKNTEVPAVEETNYSIENNRVLFNNQQGKITVDEILENILNNYKNLSPTGIELLEKARRLIGRTGAKFQFVSEQQLVDKDTVMQINSETNTIQVNRNRLNNFTTDEVVMSFIHELAHAQTLQALLNPITFEEKEFAKLIKEMYEKYWNKQVQKQLDETGTYDDDKARYGFTNEKEFVAEIYANKSFRDELKSLDKENNTSYWKQFIESLRRLFGLAKTKETDNLIEEIIDYVQQDRRDYRGTNLQRTLFANKIVSSRSKIETIENRLEKTLNKAKDNLDNLLERSKSYKKNNESKGAKFEQHIKELIAEIEKVDSINQWKGVAVYTKSMLSTIEQLETRLKGEDLTQANGLEIIELYKSYMSSYDLIEDVSTLITSLNQDKIDEVGQELVDEIEKSISDATGKHDLLEKRLNSKLKDILKTQLNNINYLPQVENNWKERLSKEFKQRGLNNISQTEWVAQQMNTTFKDEIQIDLDKEIEFLLNGIGTDISSASVKFMDAINNNSRLVSITMNLLTQAREKTIEQTREGDFKDAKLFESLVKEKGTSVPTKLYANLLEFDSTGKAYYKGEYSIKFKEEFQKLKADKNAKYTASENNFKDAEYIKAKDKFAKWKKENTTLKDGVLVPTSKWKNDLSKLSKIEKEVLNHFINDTKTTDSQTNSIQSLIQPFIGINYYNLPSVTKSDVERTIEGNLKGIVKDKIKDLTEIRPDDIGYVKQRLDSKGNSVNMLRVHYRGDISPDQQSLDLFTINRLNRINGINYKEKQAISLQVEAIKMVAKNKEYYNKTVGGISILNKFAKREQESTKRGIDSNEYQMINNLIEKNIYDLFNITYGKLGPLDINKVISTANGWVSSVGLSLNTFSAAANILNAQAQIFLERVAGNHLAKGSVKKAHEIYTKDFANIIGDYSRPVKQSFVNQVNQMFDTFGGFTVQQQEFIKNTIAKTAINFESLQILHSGGEHYVQSVMVLATLESIKVMDANNNYIDKDGNIVKEDKAISVLDMLAKDDKGIVRMNDKVVYTTRSLNSKINEGGKEQLLLFVKKKIFDTMGNYDSNLQPEAYRHWWGKMIMLFRRYLIPQAVARFRGAQSFYKHQDNLTENDIHFNNALRTTEEGSYVSTARFLIHGVYPALRQLKFDILSSNWNKLSNDKKAGIKRSVMELALTGAILPLIGMLAAGGAGDGDDEWLWTVAFLARRLESELSQFRDPREATKITKSPIPSLRIIEQTLDVAEYILPWNWAEINDRYESGKNKDELKIKRKFEKLIPVISKLEVTSEEMYNGLNSRWGR
jgi:hypothetical protein